MPLGTPTTGGIASTFSNVFGGNRNQSTPGNFGWSTSSPSMAASSARGTYSPNLSNSSTGNVGNAMSSWLQSQIGASNGLYSSQLGALGAQMNAARAGTTYQTGINNQLSGLNGQLLNQQKYRDVTLGRQQNELAYRGQSNAYGINSAYNSAQQNFAQDRYDLGRNDLINQRNTLEGGWDEEQRYIDQLRGFGIQGYNLQGEALNYASQANTRDLGESNRRAAELISEAERSMGLSLRELDSLRKMSGTQRDDALKDVAAARGFNDRDLAELNRALDATGGFNDQEWQEVQRSVGADRGLAGRSLEELQRDLGERRGTTDEDVAIQRWLNQQNTGTNDAALNLALKQSAFQEQAQRRDVKSAAVTGGALSSRGLGLDYDELRAQRGFQDEGSQLQHGQTADTLAAQLRGDENQYQAALDQLTSAYNQGQISYDTLLEQLAGRTNQGQLAYDRGQESILGARNQGQLGYDQRNRQLSESQRNANTQYNNDIINIANRSRAAREQFFTTQSGVQAQQRAGVNAYDDTSESINQQRQQNLLGYQQNSAGLQNRYNTGQLGYRGQSNQINNQSAQNSLSLSEQQRRLQYEQSLSRNNFGQQQGMYNINNQSLNSLGQTYGTRSRQNQVQTQSQNAALQNQLAQSMYGYGQQGLGLLGQQQQANASLYAQAMGYGYGTY